MKFEVYPQRGVNNIEFGMHFELVRKLMAKSTLSQRRGGVVQESGYTWESDVYFQEGVRFDYDAEGHLEAAEFFSPANVWLAGVKIFDLKVGDAISALARIDPDLVVEPDGATSLALALGIWVEHTEDGENAPIESFLVGRPGYYDFLRPSKDKR